MNIIKKPAALILIGLVSLAGISALSIFYSIGTADEISQLQDNLKQNIEKNKYFEKKLIESNKIFNEKEEFFKNELQKLTTNSKKERINYPAPSPLKKLSKEDKKNPTLVDSWLISEAEYLLQLANDRLNLAKDLKTAKNALIAADEKLMKTNNTSFDPIRKQIAFDIQLINVTKSPDKIGISAKISALNSQIMQLPLKNASMKKVMKKTKKEDEKVSDRNWDNLINNILIGLQNTIKIQKRDEPISTILPPEQQYFIFENLKLFLESSRMAMIQADNTMFQYYLEKSKNWIEKHFYKSDNITKEVLLTIDELMKIEVNPKYPNISKSLSLLKEIKEDLHKISFEEISKPQTIKIE
tara:strand:+ start:16590 stop:17657 length:1068 start_codon:yes stop_codon:yes gene_type:complete